MSKDYTGHTADEVRDLVRMCASQYDIHSADEWMSIMRKAHALLQNDSAEIEQQSKFIDRLLNCIASFSPNVRYQWDDERKRVLTKNCPDCGYPVGSGTPGCGTCAELDKSTRPGFRPARS